MEEFVHTARVAALIKDRWNMNRVAIALQAAGLHVDSPADGLALLSLLGRRPADVILVEDRKDEIEDCLASLRFHGLSGTPVMAIGPGSIEQIVEALSHGASDYLCITDATESMAHRVLARIAMSQRSVERSALRLGELVFDPDSRVLRAPGIDISFTCREFELAWMLAEKAGEVVNLHTLSRRVWGREASLAKRTIEQHVSRVRQKLVRAGAAVGTLMQLQAVHNIGYRLTHAPLLRVVQPTKSAQLPMAA